MTNEMNEKKPKANRNVRRLCCLFFILFCLFEFFCFCKYGIKNNAINQKQTEAYFREIQNKKDFIDLFGYTQKLFGKRQIENFTIYKTKTGRLVKPRRELTKEENKSKFLELYRIIEYLNKKKIPYYYLTSILPIQNIADLPIGVLDGSIQNQAAISDEIQRNGVENIDLQTLQAITQIGNEFLFYRTDHHWRLETCFAAYREIIRTIENKLAIDLNGTETINLANYNKITQMSSFLGSYGVKVGKYYTGKDDFVVYIPRFDTSLLFQSYNANGDLILEKTGDFYHALLDENILNNNDYENKYNAFCNYGYVENRIINLNVPNDLKCLFISHSYGRPLTMYLSLNFKEVVNLDPQEGRFNKNYLTYIDDYDPDIVLFQCEFEGEIIGNYKTID